MKVQQSENGAEGKLTAIIEGGGRLWRVSGRLIAQSYRLCRWRRKQQYEKQEKTDRKLYEMVREMQGFNSRMSNVEEPVANFNRRRERGPGAIMLISFIAASLDGLLLTSGKKIWAAIVG